MKSEYSGTNLAYEPTDDYEMDMVTDGNIDDDYELKEQTKQIKQNNDLKKNDPDEPEELDIKNIAKKVIKIGNISCEVDEYSKTKQRLDTVLKKWGAYITQENEYRYDYQIGNNIVIRVEVEKFDSLVEDLIIGVKTVESKQITARDVTEEYVDVYARLQNKKKEEAQYLEVLKKAYTIS